MLKIKEEVDLKSIGLTKDDEDFIYMDEYGICCEEERVIYFGAMGDFIMTQDRHLDRLYDLIQAGLVEKVEE